MTISEATGGARLPIRCGRSAGWARRLGGAAAVLLLPTLAWGDPGTRATDATPILPVSATAVEPLSDSELAEVRGGTLASCERATRKRVILWDEARSAEMPHQYPNQLGNRVDVSPGFQRAMQMAR
jgi:hypothetical protein